MHAIVLIENACGIICPKRQYNIPYNICYTQVDHFVTGMNDT